MGRKRHTAEEIIGKLRTAEIELAKGLGTAEVVRKLGITEQTYYRWRKEYGGRSPWSARPGSNRRPSAWECDGGRETALVFASGVEIGVFKVS